MTRSVRIAAIQLGPADEDRRAHLTRMVRLLDEACRQGAQIACFPELALTPYFAGTPDRDVEGYFDVLPGPAAEPLLVCARRHEVSLILPYAERDGATGYNTALVVGPDGVVVGRYRKVHLPGSFPPPPDPLLSTYERVHFAPGNLGFPVFALPHARIGLQICYDQSFPEGFRALVLQGAEIIFCPTNAFRFESDVNRAGLGGDIMPRVRAFENGVFVVRVMKRGVERGRRFVGTTTVAGPRGDPIASSETDGDEIVLATLDLDDVVEARRRFPWPRDRRPELYGVLAGAPPHRGGTSP